MGYFGESFRGEENRSGVLEFRDVFGGGEIREVGRFGFLVFFICGVRRSRFFWRRSRCGGKRWVW